MQPSWAARPYRASVERLESSRLKSACAERRHRFRGAGPRSVPDRNVLLSRPAEAGRRRGPRLIAGAGCPGDQSTGTGGTPWPCGPGPGRSRRRPAVGPPPGTGAVLPVGRDRDPAALRGPTAGIRGRRAQPRDPLAGHRPTRYPAASRGETAGRSSGRGARPAAQSGRRSGEPPAARRGGRPFGPARTAPFSDEGGHPRRRRRRQEGVQSSSQVHQEPMAVLQFRQLRAGRDDRPRGRRAGNRARHGLGLTAPATPCTTR